ncbi:MAG: abortive infection family protein, partial [Phascolarctobacterium sp.]|nr:abortive infection family protein [Candidatus Phascolarctobacterium caballi]
TLEKVEIEIPKINKVDRSYIRDVQDRAIKDVEEENFDSAITKAKTLLEEVFKYVLENRGIEQSKSISMSELYKKVREEYGIKTGNEADIRINKLISGLNTIVDAVVEMRNIASDSHGLGSKRISVENHHALLIVNAACIVADFILAVANKKNL